MWVWPDGTAKTGTAARKIEVDKTKISVIVDVEACIGNRYTFHTYFVQICFNLVADLLWNPRKMILGRTFTPLMKFYSRPKRFLQ